MSRDLAEIADLIRSDDLSGARRALDGMLLARPAEPALLDLDCELRLRERHPEAALEAARAALAAGGYTGERMDLLGRCLNNLGRLPEAAQAFGRAVEMNPHSADAHARLGHVLRRMRKLDEAEGALSRAIELDPGHPVALRTLGLLHLAGGRPAAAARPVRDGWRRAPEDAGWPALLGIALHRSGDLEGAEQAYRRSLAADDRDADTWMNLGITLHETGRLEEAVQAYREAGARAPANAAPRHRLAEGLLVSGQPEQALSVIEGALVLDGGDPTAIAIKIAALQALGREQEAGDLLGLETLIEGIDLAAPEGFEDIAEYDRALARHVLGHPSLAFEPEGHATRRGRHTRDLLVGEKGPVAGLEAAILGAVEGYLERLQVPPGHPFPGRVPRPHRLTMWAVVMDTEGHQLPHIHPAAWLSGVYYVELPESLGAGGGDVAGWIEFGLAPDELRSSDATAVRLVRPQEGRLYLFPSFLYHRTIPFGGDARRISIAFDLLRRPGD